MRLIIKFDFITSNIAVATGSAYRFEAFWHLVGFMLLSLQFIIKYIVNVFCPFVVFRFCSFRWIFISFSRLKSFEWYLDNRFAVKDPVSTIHKKTHIIAFWNLILKLIIMKKIDLIEIYIFKVQFYCYSQS